MKIFDEDIFSDIFDDEDIFSGIFDDDDEDEDIFSGIFDDDDEDEDIFSGIFDDDDEDEDIFSGIFDDDDDNIFYFSYSITSINVISKIIHSVKFILQSIKEKLLDCNYKLKLKLESQKPAIDEPVNIPKVLNKNEAEICNSSNSIEENSKNIPDNKFIQIIYDGKLYDIPLDQYILLNIKQQDDIEIVLKNGCIIRDGKGNEETFKINNALRRAYLNRLFNLNISKETKEYLKKYDSYIEYNGEASITSAKTMVNELAYIYYLEYTNKFNNINLESEAITTVRLDKGLDKTLIKKMK